MPIKDEWISDDGRIRLILGDCLEVFPLLDTESIDGVLTDPPYGVVYDTFCDGSPGKPSVDWGGIQGDDQPHGEWISGCYPLMKDGSALYMFCRQDVEARWRELIVEAGLRVKQRLVWFNGVNSKGDLKGTYCRDCEDILFASKGRHIFVSGRRPSSILRGVIPTWDIREHPHRKPESVVKIMIETSVPIDGTVLDPFVGSGTTGVACVQTGRRFVGIEVEQKYFDVACTRIKKAVRLDDSGFKLGYGPRLAKQPGFFVKESKK